MAELHDDQLRQLCEALGWQGGTFWQVLAEVQRLKAAEQITLPLADAQMLLAWMDETFGNIAGTDWHDEDAAAVGDALHKAIEDFKAMRAACGVGEVPRG